MSSRLPTSIRFLGCALALSFVTACAGIVSLGDPGEGKNRLDGEPGADADAGSPSDTNAAKDGGSASDADAVTDWPGMASGQDGSTTETGIGEFRELIWQRWWPCSEPGRTVCKQEFWVNAACETYWNDRDVVIGRSSLLADDCDSMMNAFVARNLAASLADPTACPVAPSGGKYYELHTGDGTTLRKRVDICEFAGGLVGGSFVEKIILVALRTIPGAKPDDLHMQMSDP